MNPQTPTPIQQVQSPFQDNDTMNLLFPVELPVRQWTRFEAQGYRIPVCSVIYDGDNPPVCGAPLGGIDTGCLDIEASGLLGFSTIFNSHVPRRGPLNLPFLGLSLGDDVWVLAKPEKATDHKTCRPTGWGWPSGTYNVGPQDYQISNVRTPRQIRYWGHYPMIDMEFALDAPVSVSLRAFSPFIPGDVETSMMPGAVFEIQVHNHSGHELNGSLVFSFPGPTEGEAQCNIFQRRQVEGEFCGTEVRGDMASYALGVIGPTSIRTGGELGIDNNDWANIAQTLPQTNPNHPGSSVAADFALAAYETKTIRFVLSWYAPTWNARGGNWKTGEFTKENPTPHSNWERWGSDGPDNPHDATAEESDHFSSTPPNTFTHRYARFYPDAITTARRLAKEHTELLTRIFRWQEVIYQEESLPGWLQDSLINNLYLITECGMWAQVEEPVPEWINPSDGLFAMNECPRGCPQMECTPCSFYGSLPLVYFFPECALSTLRAYKGYQHPNGATSWNFGYLVDVANQEHTRMQTLNGLSYAAMVDRYRMCWGNASFTSEFYDSLKRNMEYVLELSRGDGRNPGEAVVSMPSNNASGISEDALSDHWFESPEPGWFGMAPHVGGLHLAQLHILARMAEEIDDKAYADRCREISEMGKETMESHTWVGDNYLTCLDQKTGKVCDYVFGYQLDGQWVADAHGVPAVFDRERIGITLDTIRRCNFVLSRTGATNYANRDATQIDVQGYGPYAYFPPELLMLAMTYIYSGQREFGLELARRCWENLFCTQGYTWDMPNIISGGEKDDGTRNFGADYYQNLMLWALPAALDGTDLAGPCQAGGLVDRIRKAGQKI